MLVFLFLSSCSEPLPPPRIGYKELGKITKNDDYKKVTEYLNREPIIEKEILLGSTNERYKFLVYKRWIQTYASIFGLFYSAKYDLFVVSFKNDKLFFWGNLDDFKRSDDETVSNLGVMISEAWLKENKE